MDIKFDEKEPHYFISGKDFPLYIIQNGNVFNNYTKIFIGKIEDVLPEGVVQELYPFKDIAKVEPKKEKKKEEPKQEEQFVCDKCSQVCKSEKELTDHKKWHRGNAK
jgi:hypothetical protein